MSVKFWLNLKKEVWYFILKGGAAAALRAAGGAVVQHFHKRQRKSLETRVGSFLCACCDQQAGVRAENKRVSITSDYRSEMTKVKKEKVSEEGEEAGTGGTDRSYQELIAHLNPIAQPLASKKLSKKLYKCVKKGEKKKNNGREMLEIAVLVEVAPNSV